MVHGLSKHAMKLLEKDQTFSKLSHAQKNMLKKKIENTTPTDSAAWEDFMVKIVKGRICVKFLNDQKLKQIIKSARKNISKQYSREIVGHDPDMPECYYWDENECAKWICMNNHPELKEAFLLNHICGRKLVALDACALAKMGYNRFNDIKDVTLKIRELLEIPRPNMMRALARLVPMEIFLKKRIYNGRNYDKLTFQKFCDKDGFPYHYLQRHNVNASIPATGKALILLADDAQDEEIEDSSENNSLVDTPTVEFIARNVTIRNRIIQSIIDNLLEHVTQALQTASVNATKHYDNDGNGDGAQMWDDIMDLVKKGMIALGLEDEGAESFGREKLEFIRDVGKSLVKEMVRTEEVLRDINETRANIRKQISTQEFEDMKKVAGIFMEDVMPIAALLALGELDLETMFKRQPDLQEFVSHVVGDARKTTKTSVMADSIDFVNEVTEEAKITLVSLLYPDLPIEEIRLAAATTMNVLDDLIRNVFQDYDDQQKAEAELDYFVSNLDPLPRPSQIQRVGWGLIRPLADQVIPDDQKFDSEGNPILERLNSVELDQVINSQIIYTQEGDPKIVNTDNNNIIEKAKLEKTNRKTKRQEAYNRFKKNSKAQGAQGKKFSGAGKRNAKAEDLEEEETEETILQNEKYDSAGVPIFSKLNDDELNQIITKRVVNRGGKGEDVLQPVPDDIIIAAQAEKRRREQAEFIGKVRFTDYRRNYPGQVDQYGRYMEYDSGDKVDESGPVPKLIIPRLNTGDLENLITDGMLNGKIFNMDDITLEAVKGELERRLLETVQDKLRWQTYQRKYPGKITPDGDFKEYSVQDKFDEHKIPVIPTMNDEELENIIMNGFTHGEDGGIQYVTEDVIAKALQEKLDRSHEQDQLELQFDSYRRNYPGKYDNENIHQEYTASEKLDSLNLPILARLNTKELEKLIQTGTFENINLNNISKVDKDKLIQNAKLENEKRQQEELIAQVEQGIKHLNFPGAVVQGQFKEYSLQAKFNKLNGYPILKRLNNDEINDILEFGLIPVMEIDTAVISKIYNVEFLEQVKQEKQKRQGKKAYALKQLELLQDKVVRRVMLTQATNISNNRDPYLPNNQQNQSLSPSPGSDDPGAEKPETLPAPTTIYKDSDKYDAKQKLIMERLTDAELSEIIQASALENTQQAIMDQAEAITEQQRRLDEQEQVRRWKIKNQQKLVQVKNSKETSIAALNKILELEAAGKGQSIRKSDLKYQSILEKQKNGLNSNSVEQNPTTEQRRQSTLDHIMGLIDQQNTIRTDSILSYQMSFTGFDDKIVLSKAYLALFNGFIIDHESNIVGTVDPIDGKIKNTSGEVTGIVRPDGIVLLKGQTSPLGILGADVEQIGRGQFRAIPKPVNPDALASTNLRIIEQLDPTEQIAPWNVLQASVQGEVFVNDGDNWVQETIIPGKPDPNTGIRLAQQIQTVGGFNPEHVVILDDDTAVKIALQRDKRESTKRGILKQSDLVIPEVRLRQKYNFDLDFDADADEIQFPTNTESNTKAVTFEWKRKEKRKVVRTLARLDDGMAKLSLSRTAVMTKGKTTKVKIVPNSNFLVTVPVSGKWGVQEAPHDEEKPHMFKPPPERKFFDPSEWQAKVDDFGKSNLEASDPAGFQMRSTDEGPLINESPSLAKLSPSKKQVRIQTDEMLHGEPKILIGEDGKTIGEIQTDGQIYSIEGHEYMGKIKSNGTLVNAQGLHMPTPSGFKIARQNGVVVGNISGKGKVEKPKEIERFLIGRIWADGRIVSMDSTLIGVVGKNGEILGAGGKSIGTFTPNWELLGTNGIPFAYVTSEGKVYRFEVIPQQEQTNKRKLSDNNTEKLKDPNNNAAAAAKARRRKESAERDGTDADEFANERNSIDYSIPGNSQAIIAARLEAESENEKIMTELMEKKKELEKLRREEDKLRRYDKDDSHKVGKSKVVSRAVSFSSDTRDSFDDASSLQSQYTGSMTSGASSGRSPKEQAIFLQEKRDHRSTLVENWAHEVGSLGSIPGQEYFSLDPSLSKEDRQRIVRMAADSIVDDIFKLALTRLLLQAEAGKDTATIMAAFEKIRTTGEDYTQAMWKIDGYAYDNSSTFVLNKKMKKAGGKRHHKHGEKSALDLGGKVPKDHGPGHQDGTGTGKPITTTEQTADAGTHTDDGNAKNYPPLIKEHDGKERERRHSRQPHRHHHRRLTIQRRRSSHAQSLEEHEHEQQHNIHERQERGHGHHRRHRQRRESGESDEGSIERTHKHPHRLSIKSDEGSQEHHRRQTIPDTKGLFKRIIDADEIQKAVIAQMPFTRLEQQALGGTGQPPSGRKNTLLSQGGGKEHQQHHGRLQHIPLPDSQQHHLLQQANKEERAEEIHHGFHQLEAMVLPTHPQRRNTRTSK